MSKDIFQIPRQSQFRCDQKSVYLFGEVSGQQVRVDDDEHVQTPIYPDSISLLMDKSHNHAFFCIVGCIQRDYNVYLEMAQIPVHEDN